MPLVLMCAISEASSMEESSPIVTRSCDEQGKNEGMVTGVEETVKEGDKTGEERVGEV